MLLLFAALRSVRPADNGFEGSTEDWRNSSSTCASADLGNAHADGANHDVVALLTSGEGDRSNEGTRADARHVVGRLTLADTITVFRCAGPVVTTCTAVYFLARVVFASATGA